MVSTNWLASTLIRGSSIEPCEAATQSLQMEGSDCRDSAQQVDDFEFAASRGLQLRGVRRRTLIEEVQPVTAWFDFGWRASPPG
jgi:hypothetical protein